jgi:hypothetical protein
MGARQTKSTNRRFVISMHKFADNLLVQIGRASTLVILMEGTVEGKNQEGKKLWQLFQ